MEEKKPRSPALNWSAVLLLTAAAGSLVWWQTPLTSSRPGARLQHDHLFIGDQEVEARLWQDPFAAVYHHQHDEAVVGRKGNASAPEPEHHSIKQLIEQVARFYEAAATNPVIQIMPVLVAGGPYAEDTESRLRSRQAVVSALGVAGYAPENSEAVGYFEAPWQPGTALTPGAVDFAHATNETSRITVPFEWFGRRRFQGPRADHPVKIDKVLVLWLKEEAFADLPLLRLAQLIHALRAGVAENFPMNSDARRAITNRLPFTIIGPRGSTTLRNMLPEYEPTHQPHDRATDETARIFTRESLSGVKMFSPTASAPDELLVKQANRPTRREPVRAKLAERGLDFINVTCTEDELMRDLAGELARRNVRLQNPKHHVVVVSEHDTFYGRYLPWSLAVEALRAGTAKSRFDIIQALRQSPTNWPATIHAYNYLRGIDGKLPGDETAKRESEKERKSEKSRNQEDIENPEGQNQLDYIPRLAARLKEVEQEVRRDGGKLKAIGVLGSDVYDKLLVLQALHGRFPGVIFFTTDLDARLYHPSQLKWARNLLVVSSFGLELNPRLQAGTPPFRDTLQTSQYLACLLALGHATAADLRALAPRIYEIGQGGPYDLTVSMDPAQLHPLRPDRWLTKHHVATILLNLLLAGFGISLIVPFSAPLRRVLKIYKLLLEDLWRRSGTAIKNFPSWRWQKIRRWKLHGAAWAVALPPFALAGVIIYDHFRGAGEPFSVSNGLSSWPTVVVQFFGAYLSVYFLASAHTRLRRSKLELCDKYFLDLKIPDAREIEQSWTVEWQNTSTHRAAPAGWLLDHAREMLARWRWIAINRWDTKKFLVGDKPEQRVNAFELCRNYNQLGYLGHRNRRFLAAFGAYVLFAVLVAARFPLFFEPYRGSISATVGWGVFVFCLLTEVLLTFFVVDATRLCTKFIENMAAAPTLWPAETSRHFEVKCHLHRDYLNEWINIKVIADRTKVIDRFIFYPFAGLFLLIVSRNPFFDRWDWSVPLIVVLGSSCAYAACAVMLLRRRAEETRQRALDSLREKLLRVLGGERKLPAGPDAAHLAGTECYRDEKAGEKLADQIRSLIREVEQYDEGAFAPLAKHPVIGAILMPFGGAGVLAFLELLATAH